MRLEDDDLYDYEQDSFDEDAAIAEVVAAAKPDVISAAQAEAELEKADWEVDVAVASVRKRKPKPKPQPKPQPDADPKGKLTPLQRLAQQRAQQQAASANSAPTDTVQAPAGSEQTQTPQPPKTGLAALAAQRRATASGVPLSGALDKLRNRKRSPVPEKESEKASESPLASSNVDSARKSVSELANKRRWQPEISFAVPSATLNAPSAYGAVIGVTVSSPQNRRTNYLVTAKSAAAAFSQPSPDDKVLNAQTTAFSNGLKQPTTKTPKTAAAPPSGSAKLPAAGSSGAPSGAAKQPIPPTGAASLSGSKEPKAKAKSPAAPSRDALEARLKTLQLKPSCSFVVIGHVDAGKSTLMGRLLLDTGALDKRSMQKFEHESAKAGKSSFALAWALDATAEERARGVTVDIGEARFETKAARYTVLDAPGHRDYVPNMIAGVTQADLAVLVVDSDTNAFESGFALDGQTKEHAVLARSLGLDKLVVAVNKMDTQGWSEDRFVEICAQLTEFLTRKVGFQAAQVVFVPTSGAKGTNVVARGDAPSWYEGPALVGALDEFAEARKTGGDVSEPLRFVVSNAYTEPFQSMVTVAGRVLSGSIEPGDELEVVNARETVRVRSVVDAEFLVGGDQGEIKIEGADGSTTQSVRPGDVIAGFGSQLSTTQRFVAKVRLFDLPRPVLPGTPLAFHLGRFEDTVKVVRIIESLDQKNAKRLRHLGRGAAARVELQLSRPAVLAKPEVCKDLGRFVLRLNGLTVGGGVVEEPSVNN